MPPALPHRLPLGPGEILLQSLALPDPSICGEGELFLHRTTNAALDLAAGRLHLPVGASAWTETYVNILNLGTWSRAARLSGLWLRLVGEGRVALRVTISRVAGSFEILSEVPLDLTPDGTTIDLGTLLGAGPASSGEAAEVPPQEGLVSLRLAALDAPARLDAGGFLTGASEAREIRLGIAVTTFRREAEVAETAARIGAFLDQGGVPGAEMRLYVVDNGGTAELAPHPAVQLVRNPNLGGAGGFARGLAEATDWGASHVLFMDDDATFQMESLARTVAFLRLARSERAAVSGAMISAARKWVMWENGAVFHRMCRPGFVGTDLRDPIQMARMELAAARPKPPGFYAGWWFFAFPVAAATHWPFPFFVRGDDISFSLANRFDTVTLSGVVSYQEDFSAKESPLTLYLDLRNHLHHHLVHDAKEIGPWRTAAIAMHFLLRSIIRMHYDSAEAQLLAWEDVMRGPDFFARNADMAEIRPRIGALARREAWAEGPLTSDVAEPKEPSRLYGQILKFTLNGHLIPGWKLFARGVAVPAAYRGLIWPLWGKSRARFFSVDGTRSYEVVHSKRRFLSVMARAVRLGFSWRRAYPALREAHRAGYARLTARPFWEEKFARQPASPDSAAAQAAARAAE